MNIFHAPFFMPYKFKEEVLRKLGKRGGGILFIPVINFVNKGVKVGNLESRLPHKPDFYHCFWRRVWYMLA